MKKKGIWKMIFLSHTLLCCFLRESIEIFYFLKYINENKSTFFSVENLFTIAALMSSKHHGNKCIQEYSHYSFCSSNYVSKFPVTVLRDLHMLLLTTPVIWESKIIRLILKWTCCFHIFSTFLHKELPFFFNNYFV